MYGINGDHGFIPLGKYSCARDSILHFLCMSEWDDGDSFGDTSKWGSYVWKITNTPADVQQANTEFTSVLEEWLTENPEVVDSEALRLELVGAFIVSTNDQGFVYVESFEAGGRHSAADVRDMQFSLYLQAYEEFNSEDGE